MYVYMSVCVCIESFLLCLQCLFVKCCSLCRSSRRRPGPRCCSRCLGRLIGAAAGYLIIFIDEELTAVEMEMVGCLLVTAAAVLVDRPEDKGADKGGGDRDSTDSEGILPGPLLRMEISIRGEESPKSIAAGSICLRPR